MAEVKWMNRRAGLSGQRHEHEEDKERESNGF
jgi:hypothetical protein